MFTLLIVARSQPPARSMAPNRPGAFVCQSGRMTASDGINFDTPPSEVSSAVAPTRVFANRPPWRSGSRRRRRLERSLKDSPLALAVARLAQKCTLFIMHTDELKVNTFGPPEPVRLSRSPSSISLSLHLVRGLEMSSPTDRYRLADCRKSRRSWRLISIQESSLAGRRQSAGRARRRERARERARER